MDDTTATPDAAPGERRGFEQPPERLRSTDRRWPVVTALVLVGLLALLAWEPWAPADVAPGPAGSPPPGLVQVDGSLAPSAQATVGTVAPTVAPEASLATTDAAPYVSIPDNQWTVVALVTPYLPASSEEPATQHNAGGAWTPGGPFLVLQQGLIPLAAPAELTADPGELCVPTGVPRDRNAVPLPAGRVAYLGVTIPGAVPRAHVTAAILGRPSGTLMRATEPVVRLAGMDEGRRYVIPSAGSGGAILFARATSGPLPSGTYRFEVTSPGAIGNRYLYACVAP